MREFKPGDLVDFHVVQPGSSFTEFIARGTVHGFSPNIGAVTVHVDYHVYTGCMRIVSEHWHVLPARLLPTPAERL